MIEISNLNSAAPYQMPWRNTISVGRAADLLRADLLEHLALLQNHIGYRYCRFHAVFHDDVGVVSRDKSGGLVYSWHQLDKIYDALLKIGLRPFVELNPMPAALASGTQTMFFYKMNVTPPKDYGEWQSLVSAFAAHLIERYGLAEVSQWYFEVWNEPNLSGFWSGSQEEYWKLYEASARALKSCSPALRVGGPATSKASWIKEFIDHCARNDVPVDFISTHLYPQDEYVEYRDRVGSPHAAGDYFIDTIRGTRQEVLHSQKPGLEIHWTEWNTMSAVSTAEISWTRNPQVDSQFAASFIARNTMALDDACDSLTWWVASDIFEESAIPSSPFSCTYGLVNPQGIPKASFQAFALINQLRGARLELKCTSAPSAQCGAVATKEASGVRVLAWNHQNLESHYQETWNDVLRIKTVEARPHRIITTTIRPGAGSAWETWRKLGSPMNLDSMEMELIKSASQMGRELSVVQSVQGWIEVPFTLGPCEVILFDVKPLAVADTTAPVNAADLAKWEADMGEKSR